MKAGSHPPRYGRREDRRRDGRPGSVRATLPSSRHLLGDSGLPLQASAAAMRRHG